MLRNRLRNRLLTGVLAAAMTVTLTPANEILAWADVVPEEGVTEVVDEEEPGAPEVEPEGEKAPAKVGEDPADPVKGEDPEADPEDEADGVLSAQALSDEEIADIKDYFKGWNVSVTGDSDDILVTLNDDVQENGGEVYPGYVRSGVKKICIDLNGHSIKMSTNTAITIQAGYSHSVDVTIKSSRGMSTLEQPYKFSKVIDEDQDDDYKTGSLTLENLKIRSKGTAIYTNKDPVTLNNVIVESDDGSAIYSESGNIEINNDADHPIAFKNYEDPDKTVETDGYQSDYLIETGGKVTLSAGAVVDAGSCVGETRNAIKCDRFECGEGVKITGGSVVWSDELKSSPEFSGSALECNYGIIGKNSILTGGDGAKVPYGWAGAAGTVVSGRDGIEIGEGCTITGGKPGDCGDSYTTRPDTVAENKCGGGYSNPVVFCSEDGVLKIGDNTTIIQQDAGSGYDAGGDCEPAVKAGRAEIGKNVTIQAGNGGNSSPNAESPGIREGGTGLMITASGAKASTIGAGTVITGGNGGEGKEGGDAGYGILAKAGITAEGVKITGGNGGKGSDENGGDGGYGVYGDFEEGILSFTGCTIVGGNGGSSDEADGGRGASAVSCSSENKGEVRLNNCPKICSGNGGDGYEKGGDVAYTVCGASVHISDSNVTAGATGKATNEDAWDVDYGTSKSVVYAGKNLTIIGSVITSNPEDTWMYEKGSLVRLKNESLESGSLKIMYSKITDAVKIDSQFIDPAVSFDSDGTLSVENSEITSIGMYAIFSTGRTEIDEKSKITAEAGNKYNYIAIYLNSPKMGGFIKTPYIVEYNDDLSSVGEFNVNKETKKLEIKNNSKYSFKYRFEAPNEDGTGWVSIPDEDISDYPNVDMSKYPVVRAFGIYHYGRDDQTEYELATYSLEESKTVTVDFYMGLEGVAQIEPQVIDKGSKATKPAEPMAEGYVFKDWYTDPTHETPFDFSLPVEKDTVVYGYWEPGSESEPVAKEEVAKVEYTSNLAELLASQGEVAKVSYSTGDDRLDCEFITFERKTGDEWEYLTYETRFFTPGTYRQQVQLSFYDEKYCFAENFKLVVDGQEWSFVQGSKDSDGNLVFVKFMSPEFVVEGGDTPEPTPTPTPTPSGGGGGRSSGGNSASTPGGTVVPETPVPTVENPVPGAPTVGNTDASFNDVPSSAWYAEAVRFVVNNGCMKGLSATEFGPDVEMNRGMVVTILYRLAGSPVITTASSFGDVKAGMYYADAVAWASSNGIVKGYEDNTFRADKKISREELVTLLYRYQTFMGADVTVADGVSLSAFGDAGQIGDYALESVKWAYGKGLITGFEDGTIRPEGNATRAQVAAMIQRLMQ